MNKAQKIILLSYTSVASFGASILTPALPTIAKQLHLSEGAIESLVTIFLLGYMWGPLLYAPLANRFGRLFALRFGLILAIVGTLLTLFTPALLTGRLLTAIGASCGLSCSLMLLYDLLPPNEAKHTLSFGTLSFTLGLACAITLGGIITQYWNWHGTFWVYLAYLIFLFFTTFTFTETLKTKEPIHLSYIIKGYAKTLKSWSFFVYAIASSFTAITIYCFSTEAPLIAKHTFSLPASHYGYWNNLSLFGLFLSGFLGRHLLKKRRPTTVLYLALSGAMLALFAFLLQYLLHIQNPLYFFLTGFVLYFFTGLFFPAASHLAISASPDRANASSLTSFFYIAMPTLTVLTMGYLPLPPFASLIAIMLLSWALVFILISTVWRTPSRPMDFSDSHVEA